MHFAKFPGKRVLHCHFLNHEDHGMMNWMSVCDPDNPDGPHPCSEDEEEAEEETSSVKTWLIPLLITLSVVFGGLLAFFLLRPFCCKEKPTEYATVQ